VSTAVQIADKYYVKMPAGPFTQGDIWTSMPLPYGHVMHIQGLIITPKCDLAHDKSAVLNYLPLLPVEDYMEYYGWNILLKRARHQLTDALHRLAQPLHIVEWLIIGIPAKQILSLLKDGAAPQDGYERTNSQKHLNLFISKLNEIEKIDTLLASDRIESVGAREFVPEKDVKRFKQDIVKNVLPDTHFLPPCPPIIADPSVALLRQPNSCSVAYLVAASRSLTLRDWNHIRKEKSSFEYMNPKKPERIMRLKSPHMESLMGRFLALFGRFGVQDLDPHAVEEFSQ
jgi:hypothetical protein